MQGMWLSTAVCYILLGIIMDSSFVNIRRVGVILWTICHLEESLFNGHYICGWLQAGQCVAQVQRWNVCQQTFSLRGCCSSVTIVPAPCECSNRDVFYSQIRLVATSEKIFSFSCQLLGWLILVRACVVPLHRIARSCHMYCMYMHCY